MKQISLTLSLLAAVARVAAHATFQESWHGTTDDAETCVRMPVRYPLQQSQTMTTC